jgi:imidazolonepropionase-like amidohydrolase
LGVIEKDALADMIVVDGNPLENLDLLSNPDKNFKSIMKDGVIYENTL